MSVLVNLPSVLFASIVTEFVKHGYYMAKFDSACCNHTLRNAYLSELGQLSFSVEFPSFIEDQRGPLLYKWARLRNIKLAFCYLSEKTMIGNQICYDLKVSEVQGLYILGCSSLNSTFVQIINSCANLTWLNTEDFDSISEMNTTILANLKHLKLHFWGSNSAVLKIIALHCKKLVCFHFNGPSKTEDLVSVLQNNPNLEEIQLYAGSDFMIHIDKFCPNAVWIHLYQERDEDFDLTVATKKVSQTSRCNIVLRSNLCEFCYWALSVGSLIISQYSNRNNDLGAFLGATKGLKSFEVDQRGLINDLMINSLIMGNFSTLTSFTCDVLDVSAPAIHRLLSECKSLQILRLSQISDGTLSIAEALRSSQLQSLHLVFKFPTGMSFAIEMLQACPSSLIDFRFSTVYFLDAPLSRFKNCVEVRARLQPFECVLDFLDGFQDKILAFSNGEFKETAAADDDEDDDE